VLPLPVITASLSLVSDQSESLVPFSLSFFSLPAATFVHSLSKSSHNVTTQSYPRRRQPNHFHLFPHPVNIQHTAAPLSPHSTPPPARARNIPTAPLNATLTRNLGTAHSKVLAPRLSCLDATLTQMKGGSSSRPTPASYSLLTTHYSLSQSIGYTMPLRQP